MNVIDRVLTGVANMIESRYRERAGLRAMSDDRYRQLQAAAETAKTDDGMFSMRVEGSDDPLGLLDIWAEQAEISERVTPPSLLVRAARWLQTEPGRTTPVHTARMFIQRGRRGFSDDDLWGFNGYMAKMLSDALRKLAANHVGFPLGSTDEEWKATLLTIADGFANYATSLREGNYAPVRDTLALFASQFENLWD